MRVIARAAGIQGTVILEAVIGIDGAVREVRALRPAPFLEAAVVEAVQQWLFTPTRTSPSYPADVWRGLGIGASFRYYSGQPANETVGRDVNGDRDSTNFDRPVRGRDDATLPIVSKVDANGLAIRNGIKGNKKINLDVRMQYEHWTAAAQTVGFYWEIYNALDRVNFGNVGGDHRSPFFLQAINADLPRTMQPGLRYTF